MLNIRQMGVKNLIKFIQKYSPDAIKYTNIENYKNKTIGIDGNLLLYKLIYAIRARGYDITTGNNTIIVTHIHALLLKLVAFRRYNINPVFVFDTFAPSIKYDTLEERKNVKKSLIEKYKKSKTIRGKRIYYYIKSDITNQEIDACKELINIFGHTIIDAAEEADPQLVQLYRAKLIDFIASDDMDILVFGGEYLLKNFTVDDIKQIQQITLSQILTDANLTMDELIQIAILLGTDYCDNKKFSPTKAYQLVKEFKDITKIPEIGNKCMNAIEYFKNAPVKQISTIHKLTDSKIKTRDLFDFLKKFAFTQEYIDKVFTHLKGLQ